jgi:hypothetical protein
MEIWKKCPLLNRRYEVSSHGRIRMIVRPKVNKGGYLFAWVLRDNGKWNIQYVHRLVAATFLGLCPEGKEVNHKDCDKQYNHIDNLEYLTSSENKQHAIRMRAWPMGERHPRWSGLTSKQRREIRKCYSTGFWSMRLLGKAFGVSRNLINYEVRKGLTDQKYGSRIAAVLEDHHPDIYMQHGRWR